jgi:hypothetical protein
MRKQRGINGHLSQCRRMNGCIDIVHLGRSRRQSRLILYGSPTSFSEYLLLLVCGEASQLAAKA